MAVFRAEKTKDYTIMSNHHLKDRRLSLKAKGLLSMMLSLPKEWDYTLKGLARISREGVDAIREAVRELEQAGYVAVSYTHLDVYKRQFLGRTVILATGANPRELGLPGEKELVGRGVAYCACLLYTSRAGMGFRWEGAVHEAIAPRGRIGYAEFVVRHEKLHSGEPGRCV